MPFDALTVAAVRQEIEHQVVGGRVQGVVVPAPLTVALEVYRSGVGRRHLVMSSHPQHARVYLADRAPGRDPQQHPPLLLLLRKYVRGGTVRAVSQPPYERVLRLSIDKRLRAGKHQEYHSDPYFLADDSADEEDFEGEESVLSSVELVVEIMGRLSNIILVDEDGTVMESVKRVPSSINRYRTVLPHQPYREPPPQDKRDPLRSTANALAAELLKVAGEDPAAPAWKGLVRGFLGVSPTLAREATFRTFGDVRATGAGVASAPDKAQAVLDNLRELLSLEVSGAWQSTLATTERAGADKLLDFAPYALTHLEAEGAALHRFDSISPAVESYFARLEALSDHAALRGQVRQRLAEIRDRAGRRLTALREQAARGEEAQILRRKGEYLLAFMHTLAPGQNRLDLPDERLSIEIDAALTPVENAQTYFREYHKAQSAAEELPALIASATLQMRFIEELETELDLARTFEDIRAVEKEIELARFAETGRQAQLERPPLRQPASKRAEKSPQPLKLQTRAGTGLLLGRTARQNEAATFKLAAPDDLWFHARNVPGAHVILRAGGAEPSEEDLVEAAALAAGYSQARAAERVEVIYTERRFVRAIPGAPPGLVNYRNERTILVAPNRRDDKTAGR